MAVCLLNRMDKIHTAFFVWSLSNIIIAIDWVMRHTTSDIQRGIRWGTFTILEDLDFADDIALLSHSHQHIQGKTERPHKYAGYLGLTINTRKTEAMILNVDNPTPVMVDNNILPCTNQFTHLGEKGRDLVQSYDRRPYTHSKIQKEVRQRFRSVEESSTQQSQNWEHSNIRWWSRCRY